MINVEDFLDKYYNQTSENEKNRVLGFLTYVNSNLNEDILKDDNKLKKFIVACFYIQKFNQNLSRSNYFRIKKYLSQVFDFLKTEIEIPSIEYLLMNSEASFMFKDLNEVLDLIDYTGKAKFFDYNNRLDYIKEKAIVVLSWYGVTKEEMLTLPSSCVRSCSEGCILDLSTISKEKLKITDERITNILFLQSVQTSYRALPSGELRNYKYCTDKFFKAVKKKTGLTVMNLTETIRMLNEQIATTLSTKTINLRTLYKNALFCEIANDQSEESLLQKIRKRFNANKQLIFGYRKEYLHWIETHN